MNEITSFYDIPPYLRRKPHRRIRWRDIGLMALGAVLMATAFFVVLMAWGMSHAHAEGVAGIIKGGTYMTPAQFCRHQSV